MQAIYLNLLSGVCAYIAKNVNSRYVNTKGLFVAMTIVSMVASLLNFLMTTTK